MTAPILFIVMPVFNAETTACTAPDSLDTEWMVTD